MKALREETLLAFRSYRKGCDEEAFVNIYNNAFADYDDIRTIKVKEMKKMEESPTYNTDGVFFAELDGETAGMVDAYVDKGRKEEKGFIQSLAVLPRFRGKGIAKKLVEKAIENLGQRGMKLAEAWAQSDRESCIHIFRSFGFKQVRASSMMKRPLGDVECSVAECKAVELIKMRFTDDEIALINKLDNEAFKEHYNYKPKTVEETRYLLLELPWFKQQNAFLAFVDSQAVGYILTGIDDGLNREKGVKYGWILDIGVLKPYRQRGVGTSLMFRGMHMLKSQGMEDALLYVDNLNPTRAIELYRKLGFRVMRHNLTFGLELAC